MNPKNQSADYFLFFDTFWNNTGLRGTVFENTDDDEKDGAFLEFKDLVNNTSSLIYNFISII